MVNRFALASLALAAALVAGGPGLAASSRVWVSGHGADQAGCGAPTAPCRSLQYAHDNAVSAGGEIDILDPAGYGAVVITKSVSIVNDGVGTAGVQAASGNAITINAGPTDSIFLRGLNVDGVGGAGVDGIVLNAAGSLTLTNCTVRHFANFGVQIAPTGALSFLIADTLIADNGFSGVYLAPKGAGDGVIWRGMIDHLVSTGNGLTTNHSGLYVNPTAAGGSLALTVAHSVFSNDGYGLDIEADGGSPPAETVAVYDANVDNNLNSGLFFAGAATVLLRHSTLEGNQRLGADTEFATTGAVLSYGDNSMQGNGGGDVFGPFSNVTTR